MTASVNFNLLTINQYAQRSAVSLSVLTVIGTFRLSFNVLEFSSMQVNRDLHAGLSAFKKHLNPF